MSLRIDRNKIMQELVTNPDPENPFFMDAKGSGIRHDEIQILFTSAAETIAVFSWHGKETHRISCGPMPCPGQSICLQGIEGHMRVKLI